MAKLGSFGAAIREFDPDGERDTFEFFGQEFTITGVIPPMLMLQLGAALAGKLGTMEANAAVWQALRSALSSPGEDDEPENRKQFNRFYLLAVERKADFDGLIRLVWEMVGAQSGRPTEQQPTSPDGPLPTSTPSNSPASDSPGSGRSRPVDEVLGGSAP